MELPIYLIVPLIAVLMFLVVSPKIHTGFVCTLGLSIISIGLLGLALQEHELGTSPRFGIDGQWQAIKIGLVLCVIGFALKLLKRKRVTVTRPRELKQHELPQVRGRGPE